MIHNFFVFFCFAFVLNNLECIFNFHFHFVSGNYNNIVGFGPSRINTIIDPSVHSCHQNNCFDWLSRVYDSFRHSVLKKKQKNRVFLRNLDQNSALEHFLEQIRINQNWKIPKPKLASDCGQNWWISKWFDFPIFWELMLATDITFLSCTHRVWWNMKMTTKEGRLGFRA